jgi:hypothetical protein
VTALELVCLLAWAVYLVGSCVAASMAWREERDFRAEFPTIRQSGRMALVYAVVGMCSWFAAWAICRHRADRRNIEAQVKAIRDAIGGGK